MSQGSGTSAEGGCHPAFRQTGRGIEGLSVLIEEKLVLDSKVVQRDCVQENCRRERERPQDRAELNSAKKWTSWPGSRVGALEGKFLKRKLRGQRVLTELTQGFLLKMIRPPWGMAG